MTQIKNNFFESIGNTPLIRLKAASEITGCNIYGKAEYLNPGGSVKDRAALALIKDAQEKKLISEGGIVVEGTAGNTGIGLCLLGNSLGYKTIIVMNDNQTQEKKDTLKNIGADLRLVPPKPYKDDGNYVKVAGRLAEELKSTNNNGVVWANQFDNTANAKGHYETTGPEIWDQTDGKIDGAFSIEDKEALPILYDLIKNEGLSLGTSCGVNIAGAIRLGKKLGPGKTIVTILCDKSDRYNSKMFNKPFLIEKGLPYPDWI